MDQNLIQVVNDELFTTSLLVAEKFNKNHFDVLRKIETLISNIEDNAILHSPRLFEKSTYITSQNKSAVAYYINRDGFTLLAMGFTGKEALEWKLKYIEAFNEMERQLKRPAVKDNRLDIARLLAKSSKVGIEAIKALYPEYFIPDVQKSALERVSDINTSYAKWIEDYGITKDWISSFPTTDIYNSYVRYCTENKFESMGKKIFYSTLETDFNLIRRQSYNGHRYFKIA